MKIKCRRCAGVGWFRGFGQIRETCPCQLTEEENNDDNQKKQSSEINDGQKRPKKHATRKPKQNISNSISEETQHESSVG